MKQNPLIYDTETTGAQRNKGNPFDPRNKLCTIQSYFNGKVDVKAIEYGELPYLHKLDEFQKELDTCSIVVGFNIKFDIHWGRRYGLRFSRPIWDCQLYHFIQTFQRGRFPSLDQVAAHWGVEKKLDVVKTEYWDKGLDTDQVPYDILEEYGAYDVFPVTNRVFEKQWAEFQTLSKERQQLILLHMEDLLVLEEMEYNGSKYNVAFSLKMGNELEEKIRVIDMHLHTFCPGVPISFNSDRQVSAFLYGGTVTEAVQKEYTFVYKNPKKDPVQKFRWVEKPYVLGQIFEPLERTGKKTDGVYSVDKTTLKKLRFKAAGFQRHILDLLLERSSYEQQKSTYCYGTPALMEEMAWEENLLHGQLNQPVVVTGRLSCSKPNLQNQHGSMKVCFESRFKFNAH